MHGVPTHNTAPLVPTCEPQTSHRTVLAFPLAFAMQQVTR